MIDFVERDCSTSIYNKEATTAKMKAFTSIATLFAGFISLTYGMNEQDRLVEYNARGYEWPLKKLVPDTPGWNAIYERRFKQIEETIDDSTARYNSWMQTISSVLQKNFTESG